MKEYQSVATKAENVPRLANIEAQEGWHLVSVIPLRYVSQRQRLELEFVTIIMERNKT